MAAAAAASDVANKDHSTSLLNYGTMPSTSTTNSQCSLSIDCQVSKPSGVTDCMVTGHVPKTECVTSGSLVSVDPVSAIGTSLLPDVTLPPADSSSSVSSVDDQDPMSSNASNCMVTGNCLSTVLHALHTVVA